MLAVAVVAASCTNGAGQRADQEMPATSRPPATTAFRPEACPFEQARSRRRRGQTAAGPIVECGYLTVPERRNPQSGTTIELAVAIVRATGPRPAADPIVYLEGGPGGSALAAIESWTSPPSPLLERRDVVLLDQRGTGYSKPRLSCDPELDDATDDTPTDDITRSCRKRLRASGIDLDAYNTGESAADVADLRAALAIERWNVLGVSYGTRLALRLMQERPAGIRSVILDSVYPPDVQGIDDEPVNAARAILALLDRCQQDQRCSAAFPDLRSRTLTAIDRLNNSPVDIDDVDPDTGEPYTITVTGDDLVAASFDTLYDTAALPSLPRALDLAARGNVQEAFDVIADPPSAQRAPGNAPADPPPSGQRPDDSDGLFLSVECAEEAPKNSAGEVSARAATVDAPLRRALEEQATEIFADCAVWDVQSKPAAATTSDLPALVLAGGLDPITPPAWGEQAARTLSRASVRVFPNAGHAVIDSGPCAAQMISVFLDRPDQLADPCVPEPIRFDLG